MADLLDEFIVEPSCESDIPVNKGENELHELICGRFGFGEAIYRRVIDHDFDIESLLVTTDSELKDLFPTPMLGTRAKFRFHLNLRRKNVSTISVSSSCREWIEAQSPVPSPEPGRIDFIPSSHNEITTAKLLSILNNSEIGVEVLKYYEENNILDDANKDILTSLIVESYFNNRKLMTIRDVEIAINAIHSIFPKECKEYYLRKRGHGLNPIGKLHDKAVNSNTKIRNLRKRRTEEVPGLSRAPIEVLPTPEPIVTDSDSDVIIWLHHNNEPGEGQYVLRKWPLFKNSFGHTLVEIDFNTLYKDYASQLFSLWPSFVQKIVGYYRKHIKDKNSLQLLKELETSIDENFDGPPIHVHLLNDGTKAFRLKKY